MRDARELLAAAMLAMSGSVPEGAYHTPPPQFEKQGKARRGHRARWDSGYFTPYDKTRCKQDGRGDWHTPKRDTRRGLAAEFEGRTGRRFTGRQWVKVRRGFARKVAAALRVQAAA